MARRVRRKSKLQRQREIIRKARNEVGRLPDKLEKVYWQLQRLAAEAGLNTEDGEYIYKAAEEVQLANERIFNSGFELHRALTYLSGIRSPE